MARYGAFLTAAQPPRPQVLPVLQPRMEENPALTAHLVAAKDGKAAGAEADSDDSREMLDVQVGPGGPVETGESLTLRVSDGTTGLDVKRLLREQLPPKSGAFGTRARATFALAYRFTKLSSALTLRCQGIGCEVDPFMWSPKRRKPEKVEQPVATLSCAYIPSNVSSAWCFLQGYKGITHLRGIGPEQSSRLSGMLPESLESMTFGDDFNQSLQGMFPKQGLKDLTFGVEFNQSLNGVDLPQTLRSLVFGDRFNQDLSAVDLPKSLEHLAFGYRFNHSLSSLQLPQKLRTLIFNHDFDQSLADVHLPESLQTLVFGAKFNQSLDDVKLPRSLQSLRFGDRFNRSMDAVKFPGNLHELIFGRYFNQCLDGLTFPARLRHLAKFPEDLEVLDLGHNFIDEPKIESVPVNWPRGLRSLTVGMEFNHSLQHLNLPASLESLTLGDLFNQKLEHGNLPAGLRSLIFGYSFNQVLKTVDLPNSLRVLTFGAEFNQSLQGVTFPAHLQHLTFGDDFNQSLLGVSFPKQLQRLIFGTLFNQSLEGRAPCASAPDSGPLIFFSLDSCQDDQITIVCLVRKYYWWFEDV
eukprot:Skav210057  [mRNA]  locus=scaffold1016:384371:394080:+ [translate_table: standard]